MLVPGALLVATHNCTCEVIFQNDFENALVDKPPEGFTPMNGEFIVRERDNNKFIESPDAPVDGYTLLFGPTLTGNAVVSARVYGTARGRRYPVFAVGLYGSAGYRLQISPGKKAIELYKSDEVKASRPFEWKSSTWLWLKLEVKKTADTTWRVSGKAWLNGTQEPSDWTLTVEENVAPRAGRAFLLAAPIARTAVRFDDLKVKTPTVSSDSTHAN